MAPRRLRWLLAALLTAATLAAYVRVYRCDFVNIDDFVYVTENAEVQAGLTAQGFRWAWTTSTASNWHPLTWLSLMLDAQLFGLSPVGFHRTNLLFHIANTLLLLAVLTRLTGFLGRSAWVAALFALHPLHVESVAWVSERKDVLSTFFGLLALLAYARYVQGPRLGWYFVVFFCFLLSLLAKPMLVTLPFLMLALDWWPLGRWQRGACGWARLVIEKLPLVALAMASSAATVWAQRAGGAVVSLEDVPLGARMLNALLTYAQYLRQMVLPVDLAAYYAYHEPRLGTALLAGTLLVAISVAAWRLRRRCPYVLVGWLWYVGTLVPVIGLVQVGLQAHADRYTYFPLMGPFLALVWGLADLARHRPWQRAVASLGVAVLLCLLVATWVQVSYWENSARLWRHALQVTSANAVAEGNLGMALVEQHVPHEARPHLEAAVQLGNRFPITYAYLGVALIQMGELERGTTFLEQAVRSGQVPPKTSVHLGIAYANQGRTQEAIERLQEALRLGPASADAYIGLGFAHGARGQWQAAVEDYREALRLEPRSERAWYGLGLAWIGLGNWHDAVDALSRAVELAPESGMFRRDLAFALFKQGKRSQARGEYRESLRLEPGWPQACALRAWTLATHPDARLRNGVEALRLAEEICQAAGAPDAGALDVLAAAQAENGQFTEAVATARRAREQAAASGDEKHAKGIADRLRHYEAGRPYRARPSTPG